MPGSDPVPVQLRAERDALIAEIHTAFEGVTREGGISWSEAEVIDGYGSEEDRAKARLADTDTSWTELATNEEWDAGPGLGGWSFLDPIGYRYYLPAAMIRMLTVGYAAFNAISLDITLDFNRLPSGIDSYTPYDLSLLNNRQRRCVARFVRFMVSWEQSDEYDLPIEAWRRVYESYWKSVE